ncbi:MAG: dodecin family protein [Acidobacteria bacterium]|jgi:hypothetical protein|nr:dodecin family protein [Acidobacteriota bacterium]
MSVAKVIEITSSSSKGFEDAVRSGVATVAETVEHVQGAWVSEQKVVIDAGKVVEYRVTMRVTFLVESAKGKKSRKK